MATTKKDLVDRIAETTDAKRTLVKTVVQDFFDEIIAELAKGNRLEFRYFGVFETRDRQARKDHLEKVRQKLLERVGCV
jgi:nucleoid DNA-binding protein